MKFCTNEDIKRMVPELFEKPASGIVELHPIILYTPAIEYVGLELEHRIGCKVKAHKDLRESLRIASVYGVAALVFGAAKDDARQAEYRQKYDLAVSAIIENW